MVKKVYVAQQKNPKGDWKELVMEDMKKYII